MDRRKALNRIVILSGVALAATTGLLQGCNLADKKRIALTEKDIPLLDEIGDTIIPTTATSQGAKAAMIGTYMVTMVNDCYNEKQKNIFIEGLNTFEANCQQLYKATFLELSPGKKKEFLIQLDKASKIHQGHYFSMFKTLTINGYFTSKIGATQARRYEAVPGKYEGCINYKKGDKPWATS